MGAHPTIVFADLTGSTGVFETLGNAKATQAVTRLTRWIGEVCESHHGRVVKFLGDGVLALFPSNALAVEAMVEVQRSHHVRIRAWPKKLRMCIKIGMATGEIVEAADGDCFGEAVNLAARLSDMAGAEEIWASDGVIDTLNPARNVRFRHLGAISIRGLAEARQVVQIEWNEDVSSTMLTVQGGVPGDKERADTASGLIELSWLDLNAAFGSPQMPVFLGRVPEVDFIVNDPRVSRTHARIDWVNGTFVLTDLSSYGTWVRFAGSETELPLRRGECVLHGSGEIALGAPFSDFSAPAVSFELAGNAMELAHRKSGRGRL